MIWGFLVFCFDDIFRDKGYNGICLVDFKIGIDGEV